MSPDALNSLFALCIGFSLAGALTSGFQALAERPAGFGLLQEGMTPHRFAAVPFLVFAAPFIIMRNTLRGAKIERRRFEFVMMATIIAGFWSMMSGTFFLMTLRAADADRQPVRRAGALRAPGRPQQIGDDPNRAEANRDRERNRQHVAALVPVE